MQDVLFEARGPVALITLQRPAQRNAVHRPMADALRSAFERFEADDSLRVAVLHGAGGHFCAGADLAAVADPRLRNELDPAGGPNAPMGPTRMALTKPLIAAIEGYAVAGGLELALLADLRVAAEDAQLGVFCRRWGVPLIDGGTVRLPRIVGMARALDLILTGRAVGAAEALACELAAFPQQCMLADRASAYAQWALPVPEALRQEGRLGVPIVAAEGTAGAARFTQGHGRHGVPDSKR